MPVGTTYLNQYRYAGYREYKDCIIIESDGAPCIRFDLCSEDIVRVWADPAGNFHKQPSFAVSKESWDRVAYAIEDEASSITIRTKKLRIVIDKQPLRINYWTADAENPHWITGEHAEGGLGWDRNGRVCLHHRMGEEEHFYGLGQDNTADKGNLDRRGCTRDMVTGQKLEPGTITSSIPVTFFMSTGNPGAGAYGMFVDNSYRMEFNMGEASDDRYYWDASGGELLYYMMCGPTLKRVIERFTWLTGRPSMPPLWSLGFIQSSCSYQNWDEYDDVIRQMRKRDIPLDAMVFDYDWAEHMQNFRWHPKFEGKSPEKLAAYKAEGIKFLISNSGPMIRKSSSNYADGLAAGVFALDDKGNPVTCGHYGGDLLDFTSPSIKEWLRPQLQSLYDDGIQGWWLDLTEPEGEPLQTVYHGGHRQRIRNVYALLNAKLYYELNREFDSAARPFILTRTGSAGIQKYGAAVWTGDVYSDYDTLAAHCPEGLNTVMSGITAWTSDSGGFISSTYNTADNTHLHLYENDFASQALLYERWLQFSCFSPIMRAHHVGPAAPYEFGPLTESGCRHYLQLRYRLLPYIYSCARETHLTGLPIMRALLLEYPDDSQLFNLSNQYLFGSELMVAPVLTPHTTARNVYFPAGQWIDYDYGYLYEGGARHTVFAPQNRIPLFVKAGAIIPMIEPARYTDEKTWDPLIITVYPHGRSTFLLYADDGWTTAYAERDVYTEIHFECETDGDHVRFEIRESNKLFTPGTYECVFHLRSVPLSVEMEGCPLMSRSTLTKLEEGEGWHWELASRILTVRMNNGTEKMRRLEIRTDGQPLPCPVPPLLNCDFHAESRVQPRPSKVGQCAYLLPPPSLPCRVQAENYDRGGESVAYHSHIPGNAGDLYRWDDVNIEVTSDKGGGYNVFALSKGDWLAYTVNVMEDAVYDIDIRYAMDAGSSSLSFTFSGGAAYELDLPDTGGRGQWATVTLAGVALHAGEQIVKVCMLQDLLQLNYMEFRLSKS